MSTAIQVISGDIYSVQEKFESIAAQTGANFEREAGFAIQVLSQNEYALKTAMNNRQSVVDAVTNIAAIGISLNPARRQAYLVPRKSKLCLDISYIGLIDLAVDTGSIKWAKADIVREADKFQLRWLDSPPIHEYGPFDGADKRGKIIGAYVVAKTQDGEYLTHTMDIQAIYDIRDRSEAWKFYKKNGNSCPWVTDEGEMCKKTVVKQAWKYWPKTERSYRVDEAIQHMNLEGEEGFAPMKNGKQIDKPVAPEPSDEMMNSANEAALLGLKAYSDFWGKLSNDERKMLLPYHESLKKTASDSDKNRTVDVPTNKVKAAQDDFAAGLGPDYGEK